MICCVCSYRRFNHFDELSGRFWLRSWAGSADSLDNPAFTRSDELLHLRALDRPCCYHDDTLSLASTCPSHGARINTIYPHRYTHPVLHMNSYCALQCHQPAGDSHINMKYILQHAYDIKYMCLYSVSVNCTPYEATSD